MEYTTHNRSTIDINGTHLQGYVSCAYDKLVEIFGEPRTGDGYKVDAEWCIKFDDGTIATIYNYKNGVNYLGEEGLIVNDIIDWHIGGFNQRAVKLVEEVVNSHNDSLPDLLAALERVIEYHIEGFNALSDKAIAEAKAAVAKARGVV